ncbi:LPXTG cell wall anchor domain-containing protein [Streptococcus salivarius]|uniref:SIALI-17 repeat-containing surface protein n=1 Tax=Streptococcus salivarius TaxID=1304 RepID=UPI000E516445|nr:SIALI-17 repeat-containing surface protein [Streptococcus salivarius]RGQ17359.1 LPXTG cell wall anchor domain-containing protein [Streptococcus salivarius]
MKTQTIAKPSFTKSKAYGLCGTLALATALLIGAGSVSADETTQPVADTQPAVANVYTADNAGNVTVTPSETVAPVAETPAPVEAQPITETPAPAVENTVAATETPAAPTTVTKQGDTINVENPNVEVSFPGGTGKYSPFEVEYKDINIPDDIAVNEGDKVVTQLPDQIGLQTSFNFDVYNGENVVGNAQANAQERKITTTFNNYFTEHPLNKKMSLKFDAKWLDVVEPGKPVTVNFNGTVKTFEIGEEGPLPTDELLSKWGSQNKDNPQIINWTLRLNTARQVLNYAKLQDTWSDNQEFVDGSQNIYFVEDPIKWTGIDHAAKDYLESWNVRADGFNAKFKEFNRIMYIDYQTRLKSAVKDSTNPTNKATLVAVDAGAISTSKVQLVGGRGDASGENKPEPTFEIPHDAPKVDIPEFEGGIPGIPEVRELPEYTEPIGTVPNEAPVHDKPEFQGGIPGIPEVRELPPFEGGVVPNDAPILDLPELEIPEEPTKPTPEKPSTPEKAPKTSVERSNGKVAQSTTTVSYKLDSEPKEVANTTVYGGVLPNTGEKEGIMSTLGLVVIAAGIASLALSFKKYNEGEEE